MQLQLSLAVADRLHETLLVRGEPLDAVEAARLLIASPNAPVGLCYQIMGALVGQDHRFCWSTPDTEAGAPLAEDPVSPLLVVDQRWVSLRHWELPDPDLADVPFVALDLETTGARAGMGKITEIGAVRIEGFREVAYFNTLVNPLRPIPPMITQITGITQEMVADAPRIEEVIPALIEFLAGAIVVAHNAAFDVGFLNYELRRLRGRHLGEGAIDTLPLARALAPGLPNYRLQTVADALGAPVTACHRALADARAAGHVFVTLVGRLQEQGVTRLGETRAYMSPSSRSAVEKLRLTRDMPKSPGTYRFVDKDGLILYVGKADRLRERVRSYFVANAAHARKVRQAVRLVERIDWDETGSSLEAVVKEQQLILEHRPPCNLQGRRPENYAYIKAGNSGRGLNLYLSSRPPAGLDAGSTGACGGSTGDPQGGRREAAPARPARGSGQPLVLGPFRGRTRLSAGLDLLQRCYPIRRCPKRPDGRPCVRGESAHCLAPCTGDPQSRADHDALVMALIEWLTAHAGARPLDPQGRADEVMQHLSRQRRYEEAQNVREACEDLFSIRRSYLALADARTLCFAALWPQPGNGAGPTARLNVVWNGELREAVTLRPAALVEQIAAALARATARPGRDPGASHPDAAAQGRAPEGEASLAASLPPLRLVAVPQKELDSLLAVRRWYREVGRSDEEDRALTFPFPGRGSSATRVDAWKDLLVNEAARILRA